MMGEGRLLIYGGIDAEFMECRGFFCRVFFDGGSGHSVNDFNRSGSSSPADPDEESGLMRILGSI